MFWPSRVIIKGAFLCRVHLKLDGTRWRTGGEVKGKLANGGGSQYSSHRFTLPRNLVYQTLLLLMPTPRLPVVDWTDAPSYLNGLVRFAERSNLVSARVPSHFKRSLLFITYDLRPSTLCRRPNKNYCGVSQQRSILVVFYMCEFLETIYSVDWYVVTFIVITIYQFTLRKSRATLETGCPHTVLS